MENFAYEVKVLTESDGRVELGIVDSLDLAIATPCEYTLEKHCIGSHYEIIADFQDKGDASRVLAELINA